MVKADSKVVPTSRISTLARSNLSAITFLFRSDLGLDRKDVACSKSMIE
jgi:hypothetical protein